MNPLKSEEIFGNWATLLLPVNGDNSIDFVLLQEEIDLLVDMRVDGIYSNGTAGEFYNQTESEFEKVNTLLSETCNASGMRFQIGCSHVNPVMSLERVRRAVEMKPGAIQVILPDWVPCDVEAAMRFLETIADYAGDVGIVLYSPGHARKVLTPVDLVELKKNIPSLVGCKVAWKDHGSVNEMARRAPGISVFVPGHYLATGFNAGAKGSYSNVACINPLAAQRWYDSMENSLDGALEVESRIQRFMREAIEPYIRDQGFSNTAADKFLAAAGGWSPVGPRVRWPYKWIPESEVSRARNTGRKILPEFFFTNER